MIKKRYKVQSNDVWGELPNVSTEAPCELDVAGHDRHSAPVDGTQARVGEEVDHVGLGGLLHGEDGARLEPQALLGLGGYFPDQALERQLAQKQLRTFLVSADVSQCDCAGVVLERLFNAAGAAALGPLGLLRPRFLGLKLGLLGHFGRAVDIGGRLTCNVLGACHFA